MGVRRAGFHCNQIMEEMVLKSLVLAMLTSHTSCTTEIYVHTPSHFAEKRIVVPVCRITMKVNAQKLKKCYLVYVKRIGV